MLVTICIYYIIHVYVKNNNYSLSISIHYTIYYDTTITISLTNFIIITQYLDPYLVTAKGFHQLVWNLIYRKDYPSREDHKCRDGTMARLQADKSTTIKKNKDGARMIIIDLMVQFPLLLYHVYSLVS